MLCPICNHGNWCSVSADGKAAMCGRIESQKRCGDAGWLHKLDKAIDPPKYRRRVRANPKVDFFKLQKQCRACCTDLSLIAKQLGVTSGSLDRLQIGYFGHSYTFPMFNCKRRIVGIKRRKPDGSKICIRGSHLGLYWPLGVEQDSKNALYICEGESDAAALLSLDFEAIGRPGCDHATQEVVGFLKGRDRHVVVMLDHDRWKTRPDGTKYKPGQDGAYRLAKVIQPLCKSLKLVRPGKYKDIRKWLNNGATHAAVQAVVDSTRFV